MPIHSASDRPMSAVGRAWQSYEEDATQPLASGPQLEAVTRSAWRDPLRVTLGVARRNVPGRLLPAGRSQTGRGANDAGPTSVANVR